MPRSAKALLWVRILNQLGAYALAFLAVFAGPELAPVALAVFGVAALISRWGGALLLDRLSPRVVVAVGLGATGLSLVALSAARTPAQILVAVALVGLAFEIYEPASQELVAQVAVGEQRQRLYALLGSALVAAGAIAGLIASALLPLGVRWLMVVDAVTCLAACGVALAFLPRDIGKSMTADEGGRRWRPPARLLHLTAASTAFAVGYLAVIMFIPLVLLQRGAPAWLPGIALTGAALLSPVALWATRRMVDALPHGRALAGGAVLLGVLALAMARVDSVPSTIAAYLAWTAANGILLGRWQAMVADVAPESERPRWFAVQGSSWGIAQPAVPGVVALVGAVAGGFGTAAFLTAGLAFLVVPLMLRGHSPA
ncbi:MFS transporter [Nonomuraea turcica]|uniref:MFS transporter n=1 Tax=Nonomuraea sp. G32 TaxID=3067274 RepID=UPI00273AAB3C|nr:MFS transporter [Nonomuraea sp. G32]MDP4505450.1 MFS transporter [Nonomuraea sp. G32]